ncbi:Two component system response regulator/histidine kinase [Desulfonema limicola]|uniref:histidine kinase n=1 Tax=Desulfonema limicola TaxID=45656 RepID=A0A975B374_9BACT|nr:response regulator [Desulfonema limicola]QTA77962.1 Two component system response regulator/histidine kinase [Desulfonema limicola]
MSDLQKKKILIVDDNNEIIQVLTEMLDFEDNYHLDIAKDGLKAFELACKNEPDLILLDIMMPGIDGMNVCKKLKSFSKTQDIPIILMTASINEDNIAKAFEAGAVDYIQKPFYRQELTARIRNQLKYRHTEQTLKKTLYDYKVLKEKAEKLYQAKSSYLSGMSHELRTPLNSILGYTQILKQDQYLNEKHIKALDAITHSSEHLLKMINGILDLSKIEAGKAELNLSDFNLIEVLKNIRNILEIRAYQKNINFRLEMCSRLPEIVTCDEKILSQILLNLLGNAIKFTEKGQVVFKVFCIHSKQNSSIIRFQIKDTGVGIAEEKIPDLFLPFHQVGSRASKQEGTGLGLAISQQLAKMMDSKIYLESTAGKGSIFWFDLEMPVKQSNTQIVKKNDEQGKIVGYTHTNQNFSSKLKLLIVDDTMINRILLRDMLKPLGFDIAETNSGHQALKIAPAFNPDMVLMDLVMPEMDGFETTKQIKRIPGMEHLIIIAVSAYVDNKSKKLSKDAGCHDFIEKPVHKDELLQKISTYLNIKWVYEKRNKDLQSDFEQQTIKPPSDNEIKKLYNMAQQGDILGIKKYAELMKEPGSEIKLFGEKLYYFAKNFLVDEIIQFISKYK